jgi:hypothetical protein
MTAYHERDIIDIDTGDIAECGGGEDARAETILHPGAEVFALVGPVRLGEQPMANECCCLTCTSGYPNSGGYRPHTLNVNCWCIGANYFSQCEITKDFPEVA